MVPVDLHYDCKINQAVWEINRGILPAQLTAWWVPWRPCLRRRGRSRRRARRGRETCPWAEQRTWPWELACLLASIWSSQNSVFAELASCYCVELLLISSWLAVCFACLLDAWIDCRASYLYRERSCVSRSPNASAFTGRIEYSDYVAALGLHFSDPHHSDLCMRSANSMVSSCKNQKSIAWDHN